MRPHSRLVTAFLLAIFPGGVACSEDPVAETEPDSMQSPVRAWMQEYAENSTVWVDPAAHTVAELVPQPVFRYADQARNIPDATLWVWARDGRPAAFQKLEVDARPGVRQWTVCFASLAEGPIEVRWPPRPDRRTFRTKGPGIEFAPIPDADSPADSPTLRAAQMKRLTERFIARLHSWEESDANTRTIPTPLYSYREAGTDLPLGAIFGMTATGTNPDVLLIVEARKNADGELRWEYAHARMTTAGVKLMLDDAVVSETIRVSTATNVFDTWTFHFLPRTIDVESP